MQLELEQNPDDNEHMQDILNFRKKKSGAGMSEERKGWGYWLSLGCVRSKSTSNFLHSGGISNDKDQQHGGKATETHHAIRLSPIKGVRLNKEAKKTPPPHESA